MADTAKFVKDPDSVLDYAVDWSEWLDSDTLATVTWTVPSGLTKTTQSNTDEVAYIWLSGGTAGTTYSVRCRVTTDSGRTEDRTIEIMCQER